MLMLVGKQRNTQQFYRIVGIALHHGAPFGFDGDVDLVTADGFVVEQNVKIKHLCQAGQGHQRQEQDGQGTVHCAHRSICIRYAGGPSLDQFGSAENSLGRLKRPDSPGSKRVQQA